MSYIEYNETDIQNFEYETTMVSDGNIIGTCELGKAEIQMLNDSNEYSSLKESWIQTVHGSFYIYDVAPVQEKVNIKLSCYDIKYKLDKPYDSSKHKFPCTLKAWRNSIFDDCEVTYDNSDFPNSNLLLEEEPYVENGASNRQVMQMIAQAGASAVVTDENDCFYFKWFEDTIHIVEDWTELTTEKESSKPVNTLVLGRGNTEDNVYYPEEELTEKIEFRIDNNYILDPQDTTNVQDRRYQTRISIYNRINGFSYLIFNMRTQNIENKLSVKLGQKVKYLDIYDNELEAYIMTKKVTYLGGDMSDDGNYEITLSAEKINETSTDLSYGSSVINDILRVERKADKNKGVIEDTIQKQGEQQKQMTQISQTVDTIQQQISGEYGMDLEVTGTNQVFIEDAMGYSPLELKITGYSDLSGLIYPSANLFPSATLYPLAYHEPNINQLSTTKSSAKMVAVNNVNYSDIEINYLKKEPSTATNGNVTVTISVSNKLNPEPLKSAGWTLVDNYTISKVFKTNTTEVIHLEDINDSSNYWDYTVVVNNIIPTYLTLCVDSQDREHPTENLKEYEIVIDKPLRSLGTTKDELSIVLEDGELKAQITRYLEYTGSQIVKLDKPTTETITCPKIELLEHTNYVYIKERPNYQVYVKYLIYSTMNNFYATKVELETTRKQTEDSIIDTVSAKYSTKKELAEEKSERIQTATEISDTVSQLSEASNNLSTQIKQKATSVEITAKDNQTSAGITVKLKNEDGTELDSKTANISMSGLVKFTDLSGSGSTVINGSNIITGVIDASKVTVKNLNASNITSGTLSADRISGGTIDASKIQVTNLDASNIKAGTLSADKISGGTISASAINLGNGVFSVSTSGVLNCSNIIATGGTIGGFTINHEAIYNGKGIGTAGSCGMSASIADWAFWAGNGAFRVTQNGYLRAISGNIGGWGLGSNYLYASGTNATSYLYSNGNVVLGGNFGMIKFDTNPVRITTADKLLLSDSYSASEMSSNNDTISIRAFSGTIHINSNYGVYAGSNRLDGASSKAIKTNIKPLQKKYINDIYKAVYDMPLYTYDYLDKYGNKDDFGFIIEDIEDTCLNRTLKITQNPDNKLVKNYGTLELNKMNLILIKELMKKIEKLEERLNVN